jgi:hypothetical protein
MSNEKTNGHDPLTVEMVQILREIRDGQQRMENRLAAVEREVGALRVEAHDDQVRLRAELNLRLDAFQEHVNQTLTGRVVNLEERVTKLEARPARRPGARR